MIHIEDIMSAKEIADLLVAAPWVKIALKDMNDGVKRIPGGKNHPRILQYWKHTNYDPRTDEESFCAAGANCFLNEAGYEGTNDPAARSFMDLPRIKVFKPGCVLVHKRGSSSWQGHVNFGLALKEPNGDFYCIGANQGEEHSVNIKLYYEENLLGMYWPKKLIKD